MECDVKWKKEQFEMKKKKTDKWEQHFCYFFSVWSHTHSLASHRLHYSIVERNKTVVPSNFKHFVGTVLQQQQKCNNLIIFPSNPNTTRQKYTYSILKTYLFT